MALILPFRPLAAAAAPIAPAFDRARYRADVEQAAHTCLDLGHRLVELLDRIDGDPDFEPGFDDEDGDDAEPPFAAIVASVSQVRLAGLDAGGAA